MLQRIVVCFLTIVLSTLAVSAAVDAGPYEFNGHEYYILTKQTWADANAEATKLGGYLVTIDDLAENDFVFDIAKGYSHTGHWIGFNDLDAEGNWVWTSGNPVTFTGWSTYEPNGGTSENCAVLEVAWGGKWNDLPCDRVHPAVVEIAVTTLNCTGFKSPMANYPVKVKGNRALPLKGNLYDADGYEMTDLDLASPPVVQVLFEAAAGGDPVDVTEDALPSGMGDEGNQCVYDSGGQWHFNLKTSNYTSPGTYTVTFESGDASEYAIDPTCTTQFVIQ